MKRTGIVRKTEVRGARVSSRDRILQAAKRLFAAKGYEYTTTIAIARLAGTSESQLIKHYGSKEGLLEGIFDQAWQKLTPKLQQAAQAQTPPDQKLDALVGLVIGALEKDSELKHVMLLEGRRIRSEGRMVLLTEGFVTFVQLLDQALGEMRAAGQLRPDLHVEAVRSALMGVWEGLMRDQILARRMGYPARFTAKDISQTVSTVLDSFRTHANPAPRALAAAAAAG